MFPQAEAGDVQLLTTSSPHFEAESFHPNGFPPFTTTFVPLLVLLAIPGLITLGWYALNQLLQRCCFSLWRKAGIPGPEPTLLKLGNTIDLYGPDPIDAEKALYDQHGPLYGYYLGTQPVLTITDPELIKQLLVKDFNRWSSRRLLQSAFHELININIFFSGLDHWKEQRNLGRQMFTSAKLRAKCKTIEGCLRSLTSYLDKMVDGDGSNDRTEQKHLKSRRFEVKLPFTGFAVDAVARSLFATELETDYGSSPLLKHTMRFFRPSMFTMVAFISAPNWFNQLFGVKHFFDNRAFDYVIGMLRTLLNSRKVKKAEKDEQLMAMAKSAEDSIVDSNNNVNVNSTNAKDTMTKVGTVGDVSQDLMNFLLNNSYVYNDGKGKTRVNLSDNQIITLCMSFFAAGFESTALTMTYSLYEMSLDHSIQDRLLAEIRKALDGLEPGSEHYYEVINSGIPYLEGVVKETLRKYPALMRIERRLMDESYELTDKITLRKGQLIEIPLIALHYRPDFWPEPDRFNPERFLPENRHLIAPYSYLPFGDGPRNCIGMRSALQVSKIALVETVKRYRFTRDVDTPDKLTFASYEYSMHTKEPVFLRIERRTDQ